MIGELKAHNMHGQGLFCVELLANTTLNYLLGLLANNSPPEDLNFIISGECSTVVRPRLSL